MSNQTSTFFSPPPSGPIKPYTGTFGQKQLHHLLRRTLFGVSTADLKAFQGKSMTQVVDALLNVSSTPPAPPVKNYNVPAQVNKPIFDPVTKLPKKDAQGNIIFEQAKNQDGTLMFDTNGNPVYVQMSGAKDDYDLKNKSGDSNYDKWIGLKMGESWVNYRHNPKDANNPDNKRRESLKAWMAKQILEQDRTIREKMTLFLHNHFATETADVNDSIMSYNHHALLRKYALGNFKKLVYDVTLDPAMLVYLNGDTNNGANAASVNENYGRELQELFNRR